MKVSICAVMLGLLTASGASAQPTIPVAPPQTKQPGQQNMVVNPTIDECKTGWNSNLKWTQTQFDQFCASLSKSK